MAHYDFKSTEKKWQEIWDKEKTFECSDDYSKPKFYGLVEFPYPSGAGMHVGHIKAYSGLEVVSRKRRLQGYNVLFPIGFDAFGLPTENYAIKTNTHPRIVTDHNIKRFTEQLKMVGFSFDWSKVIDTTQEDYYKWTQWIFLKMFEHGLVFRDKALINYCPSCKVVLSNEDSQGGKCDVCHSEIIQKSKDVWYLRITAYADKLLEGLKHVDYLPNIKLQQENWIGKSTGAFVEFKIKDTDEKLRVYTTRPDTLFGATYMVIAPEHAAVDKLKARIANWDDVVAYREAAARKSDFERTELSKEKTGVELKGIKVRPNTTIGKTITIDDLFRDGYKSVFIGAGLWKANAMHIKGETLGNVAFGIDYLANSKAFRLGDDIAVIGVGNSAMDCARTAIRNGARHVTCYARRDESCISASEYEVRYAKLEGVGFRFCKAPVEIRENGLICRDTVKGEDGKFTQVEGSEIFYPHTGVIVSVSQGSESNLVKTTTGIETNQKGTMRCMRAATKRMKAGASIVNIASVAGEKGCGGAVYVSTKAAVIGVTKHTALRFQAEGIRCNAICPGTIVTPMVAGTTAADMDADMMGAMAAHSNLRTQPCMPEDVANIALFLASDESRALTGQIMVSDFGAML